MKKTALYIIAFIIIILYCIPGYAQQTLTINLDPPQPEPQKEKAGDLCLKHEPLGSVKSSANVKYSANAAIKTSAGNDVVIGRVGVVKSAKASIRRVPDKNGPILFTCLKDTPLAIVSQTDKWYGVMMIDSSTGWVEKSKSELLDYEVRGNQSPGTGGSTLGASLINYALKFIGIPYKWGGNTASGIDCSGFVRVVFSSHGIQLPRVARDQARVGQEIGWNELQPGDRLYFACKGGAVDHAGIYMGNGLFIHSSTGHGGVAIDKIMTPLFARSLVVARR